MSNPDVKLLALRVFVVAYGRWKLTSGSKYSELIGLNFWYFGNLVAEERWSQNGGSTVRLIRIMTRQTGLPQLNGKTFYFSFVLQYNLLHEVISQHDHFQINIHLVMLDPVLKPNLLYPCHNLCCKGRTINLLSLGCA